LEFNATAGQEFNFHLRLRRIIALVLTLGSDKVNDGRGAFFTLVLEDVLAWRLPMIKESLISQNRHLRRCASEDALWE